MEERLEKKEGHKLIINNRQFSEISGVLHVDSFDDEEIVVETELGLMALRGEELDIKELNLDEKVLSVEGIILEVSYFEDSGQRGAKQKGKSILGKIFR